MSSFSYISSFGKYKYARKFEENNSKSFHAKSTQYLPKTFSVRVPGNMNPLTVFTEFIASLKLSPPPFNSLSLSLSLLQRNNYEKIKKKLNTRGVYFDKCSIKEKDFYLRVDALTERNWKAFLIFSKFLTIGEKER